jgi:hypothetical protein
MIRWRPFTYEGVVYELSHLHPFIHTFEQSGKGDKHACTYPVQVIFSLHCFTHAASGSENVAGSLGYADSRETRIFDFARYEQSKLLPDIVAALPTSPCFHTHHGNFFTAKGLNPANGKEETYEVYFTVSRAGSKMVPLNLFVQSAYVRDRQHANKPTRKKIGIFVILRNTLNGKPCKVPK